MQVSFNFRFDSLQFENFDAVVQLPDDWIKGVENLGCLVVVPEQHSSGAVNDVIKLKGPYDIAVNKQDGAYGLTADFWDGHVEKEVGKDYGKLLQLYGVHKAAIEARKKGLSVHRQQKQDGSIKLVLMGLAV